MTIADDQRGRLRQAKLAALVRANFADDVDGFEAGGYPGGATLRHGERAWVLVDDDVGPRATGGPLLWASSHGVTDLAILLGDAAPDVLADLARRAAWFDPAPTVWHSVGVTLEAVAPSPLPPVFEAPAGAETLVEIIVEAGVDVVVEQGIVRGEVLGLEVARIVAAPLEEAWLEEARIAAAGVSADFRLEVGVGKFDRVTAAMMYADLPTADALATVVNEVRRHRYPGAPPHPVRDLCRERWVRRTVLTAPELVGATELEPAETTVERDSLREVHPAIAVGHGPAGTMVVVATHGIDVDLLPMAADARELHAPGAELVVVSSAALPAPVRALAGRLSGGVRFVEIPPPWA